MSSPVVSVNLNPSTPAPPTGLQNVIWAKDSSGNVSAYAPPMAGDSGAGGTSGTVPAPPPGSAASALFLKADGTWEAPAGSGLTSVGLAAPSIFVVTGSPITTSGGSFGVALAAQAPNLVFVGPASGANTAPTFRALVNADLPVVDIANGGTGATTATGALGNIGAMPQAGGAFTGNVTIPTLDATTVSASGTVTASVLDGGTANITGAATVGSLTAGYVGVNGTMQAQTLASKGTSPAIAAGASTVMGTSPSVAVYGSSISGEIDVTVGSGSGLVAGTIATVTFGETFLSAPKGVIVPNGENLAIGLGWSTTASTLTLTCSSALTAGQYFKLNYFMCS
jgi:hypothetical protein